jgi:hypothetical protein
MSSTRVGRARGRSRNTHIPTVREIKQAICTHERLEITAPPAQQLVGGVWRTRLTCPSCGAWEIRETPDSNSVPQPTSPAPDATGGWETCAVELRCQERGTRVYPLCRYDAIAQGPTGRYIAARSMAFDNGLDRAERAAIVAALGAELTADRWEAIATSADPLPHFRRRLGTAADTPVLR